MNILQQKTKAPPWNVLELGLNPHNLNQRIVKRTKELFHNGLLEETSQLSKQFGSDLPMLQTIGYKEALETLQGKSQLCEAIKNTTRRTQQFAKKQRTWFKKQHSPNWLNNLEPKREAMSLIQSGLM